MALSSKGGIMMVQEQRKEWAMPGYWVRGKIAGIKNVISFFRKVEDESELSHCLEGLATRQP